LRRFRNDDGRSLNGEALRRDRGNRAWRVDSMMRAWKRWPESEWFGFWLLCAVAWADSPLLLIVLD
jgi:hypothetical protein